MKKYKLVILAPRDVKDAILDHLYNEDLECHNYSSINRLVVGICRDKGIPYPKKVMLVKEY